MKKILHLKHLLTTLILGVFLTTFSSVVNAQCTVSPMYSANTTAGNQAYVERLGSVFTTNGPIIVTHLGAFDDNLDGLKRVITVGIVRVSDGATVVPSTFLVGGNPITLPLTGSYRFKAISPITLPAGQYCVVAVGYGATERNGNQTASGGVFTTFNGPAGFTADYSLYGGFGFGLPTNVYNTPPTSGQVFHAGNFKFQYGAAPVLTSCPNNMTVNNDPGLCTKTVNYTISATGLPAPTFTYSFTGATTGSGSGTGSGTAFNKGTTAIAVTATNACGTTTCNTNITVLDNEIPQINCPQGLGVSCAAAVPAHATNLSSFLAAGGTVSDNCTNQNNIVVTWIKDSISNPGSCPNKYNITRFYLATDANNNSSLCSQLITVNDNVPPVITAPQGSTVQCASSIPNHVNDSTSFVGLGGTVSDNCVGPITVTWVGDAVSDSSCPNHKTITRTYKAVDACGNSATCNQTIIVNDNTPPNITPPPPLTFQCASAVPPPFANSTDFVAAGGTINDNCSGTLTFAWVSDVFSNTSCVNKFTITRSYQLTDACGNSSTCNQQITVNDNTNPVITIPASRLINCEADSSATINGTGVATATDNCGSVVITHTNQRINGNCDHNYLILRRWTATDACGNNVTQIQAIRVQDTTPPIFQCPAPLTVQSRNDVPLPNPGGVLTNVHDNCQNPVDLFWIRDVVSDSTCLNHYTITRTYKADDRCGNSTTCNAIIYVNDQTKPTISCPPPFNTECRNLVPVPAYDYNHFIQQGGTAFDNAPGPIEVHFVVDSAFFDVCINNVIFHRVYQATDACGNTATCFQLITVNQTTRPSEYVAPGGQPAPTTSTIQCFSAAVAPALPVVKDVCGAILSPTVNSPVIVNYTQNNGCSGTVTYTYKYKGCAPDTFYWNYTYTVQHVTPPTQVGSAPTSSTVQCYSNATAPTPPVFKDVCGNTSTVILSGPVVSGTATQTTCGGTVVYTFTYTDCAGLTATWAYTYTLLHTSIPVVPAGGSSAVECVANAVPLVAGNLIVNGDFETGNLNGWTMSASGGATGWVINDGTLDPTGPATPTPPIHGNYDVVSTNAYAGMNLLSELVTLPSNVSYANLSWKDRIKNYNSPTRPAFCNSGPIGYINPFQQFSVNVLDASNNLIGTVFTTNPGDPYIQDGPNYRNFNLGVMLAPYAGQQVRFQFNQNASYCYLNVTLDDVSFTATPFVTGVCGNPIASTGPVTGGNFDGCGGTKTYTYTYTDCAGLSSAWTYTYNIHHITPPTILVQAPTSSTVQCVTDATEAAIAASGYPVFKDVCGNTATVTRSLASSDGTYTNCQGTKTYTYRFTDCAGLSSTWTYTFNIVHVTHPSEYVAPNGSPVPTSSTVSCVVGAVQPTPPVFKDVCGNTSTVTRTGPVIVNQTNNCNGTVTYTWTYADCAGLTSTWTYTYNVLHTTPPTELGGPAPTSSTVQCYSNAIAPTPPVFKDACGNTATVNMTGPVQGGSVQSNLDCNGTVIYTWTYTDCAGLTATWMYIYNVMHTTPPHQVGSVATSSTVQCYSDAIIPSVEGGPALPVFQDVCGNTLSVNSWTKGGTASSNASCDGATVIYTFFYVDCANLTSTWTYTYTLHHTTPPSELGGPVSTSSVVQCLANAREQDIPAYPVFKDVCGNTSTVVRSLLASDGNFNGCQGTKTYTYRFTDCAGLSSTWTYTFNILHTTPPSELGGPVPTSSSVQCVTSATEANIAVYPVFKDVCGNTSTVTRSLLSSGGTYTGCQGTKTFTYRFTDCAGLSSTWTYTFNIIHTTPPTEYVAPGHVAFNRDSAVQCFSQAGFLTPNLVPVFHDVCGNTATLSNNVLIGGTVTCNCNPAVNCSGTVTYTYTYTDCAGLTATWVYTYHLQHTTHPFQVGGPVATSSMVPCWSDAIRPGAQNGPSLPVFTDVCGNILTYDHVDTSGTAHSNLLPPQANCNGTVIYTYTYIDCAGLTSTWVYTYTLHHTAIPTEYVAPGNVPFKTDSSIQCQSLANAPACPVFHDQCGNPVDHGNPVLSGNGNGCSGSLTYTYTYTDCAGLTNTWAYTYHIQHVTPPTQVGTAPTSSTVQCYSNATAPTPPVFRDVCGNTSTVIVTGPVVTGTATPVTCGGTVIYTYTFTDCAGLTATWAYTYTLSHTTRPSEYIAPNGTAASTSSTVQCYNSASAPTPPVFKDVCGNTSTVTRTGPVQGGTAHSNADCTGTVSWTWTYADCQGLTSTWTYTYSLQHTTPPSEFGGPVSTSSTVECATSATEANIPAYPVFQDVCGNTSTVTRSLLLSDGTYAGCNGTKTYTYRFTDCAGLSSTWTYTFNIVHVTRPVEFGGPATTNSNVECLSQATEAGFAKPVFHDVCGNTATISAAVVGGTYPVGNSCTGTKTYTYTFTDCAGLTSTWTFTYNIIHVTPPVIPVSDSFMVVQCIGDTVTHTPPSVTDVCGNAITPIRTNTSVGNNCALTFTASYKYIDCSGLSSTWNFVYRVHDSTPPVLIIPYSTSVECSAVPPVGLPGSLSATDNCSTPVISYLGADSVGYGGPGACSQFTIHRTWRATDNCGNSTTLTQTILVSDHTPPVLTIPANQTGVRCNQVPGRGTATATDNCTPTNLIVITNLSDSTIPGSCPNSYTLLRRWMARDLCGNTSTATQTLSVIDDVPPVIHVPSDVSVSCDAIPAVGTATATDNCTTNPIVAYIGADTINRSCPNTYIIRRMWSATDQCGNVVRDTQRISVKDSIAPVITNPWANGLTRCIPTGAAYTIGVAPNTPGEFDITAVDNCGTVRKGYRIDNVTGLLNGPLSNNNANSLNGVILNFDPSFGFGQIRVTWYATDQCGNTSTTAFDVFYTFGNCGPIAPPPVTGTKTTTPDVFRVKLYPNPTSGNFNIQVVTYSNEPIKVRIMDALGTVLQTATNVSKSGLMQLASKYRGGTYFVEVSQGIHKEVLKLIKLN